MCVYVGGTARPESIYKLYPSLVPSLQKIDLSIALQTKQANKANRPRDHKHGPTSIRSLVLSRCPSEKEETHTTHTTNNTHHVDPVLKQAATCQYRPSPIEPNRSKCTKPMLVKKHATPARAHTSRHPRPQNSNPSRRLERSLQAKRRKCIERRADVAARVETPICRSANRGDCTRHSGSATPAVVLSIFTPTATGPSWT